MGFFIFY